jgi:hypothetical protein
MSKALALKGLAAIESAAHRVGPPTLHINKQLLIQLLEPIRAFLDPPEQAQMEQDARKAWCRTYPNAEKRRAQEEKRGEVTWFFSAEQLEEAYTAGYLAGVPVAPPADEVTGLLEDLDMVRGELRDYALEHPSYRALDRIENHLKGKR